MSSSPQSKQTSRSQQHQKQQQNKNYDDDDPEISNENNYNNHHTSSSQHSPPPPSSSSTPRLTGAVKFRRVERSVRTEGNRFAYFAMSYMNGVLAQPPRRPEVIRRRRYDASLSLMDVIRGAADSTQRLLPQWPLEYPLVSLDAVRRKASIVEKKVDDNNNRNNFANGRYENASTPLHKKSKMLHDHHQQNRNVSSRNNKNNNSKRGSRNSSRNTSDLDNDSSPQREQQQLQQQPVKIQYTMRALTTVRIPLMRLGLSPILLHFWGLLEPSDPLKEGWNFYPAADPHGANGDIYKNAADHAGLNLFVDWPAKTFLNMLGEEFGYFDEDDNIVDEDDENGLGNRRHQHRSKTASKDEGPAILTGMTVTCPSQQLLQDCKENYFGSNSKPDTMEANARRSCHAATMCIELCNQQLEIPSSVEYAIKAGFADWAVNWRARREMLKSAAFASAFDDGGLEGGNSVMSRMMMSSTKHNNSNTNDFVYTGDADVAAAAVALKEQARRNPVNPLLELEGYAQQTAKVNAIHSTAAGQKPQKITTTNNNNNNNRSGTNLLLQQQQQSNDKNNKQKNNSRPSSPNNSNNVATGGSPSSSSNPQNSADGDNNIASMMEAASNKEANVFEASYSAFLHHNHNSLVSQDVDANPFISLTAFIAARLRGLVEKCISCQKPLIRNVVRPSTCFGSELCRYSASKYGSDFLTRLQRGGGAVAEFLILCGINAIASQREMLMPMCDLVVGGDGSAWMLTEEQQQQAQQQHSSSVVLSDSDQNDDVKKKRISKRSNRTKNGSNRNDDDDEDRDASSSSPQRKSNPLLLDPNSLGAVGSPKRNNNKNGNDDDNVGNEEDANDDDSSDVSSSSSSSSITGKDDQTQRKPSSPTGTAKQQQQHPSFPQFARHFYKKDEDVGTGSNKNIPLLMQAFYALPMIPRLLALARQLTARFPQQQVEKLLFQFMAREAVVSCASSTSAGTMPTVAIANLTEQQQQKLQQEARLLAGPLLRWLFTSMPGDIVLLPKTHLIPRVKSEIQFLIVGTDPEREARFQALKLRELERRKIAIEAATKRRTMMQNFYDEKDDSNIYADPKHDSFISGTRTRASFFAWHGSGPNNWHSILRNGLKNMSHTHMMTTGAIHGGGIYASRSMHIALSYSLQPMAGWKKSTVIPHSTGISVISLCEIVDWNGVSAKSPDPRMHPSYRRQLQHQFKHLQTSQPTDPVQVHADGQIVTVLHDDYIMPRVLVVYTDRTPKSMEHLELEIPEALMNFIENQYHVV